MCQSSVHNSTTLTRVCQQVRHSLILRKSRVNKIREVAEFNSSSSVGGNQYNTYSMDLRQTTTAILALPRHIIILLTILLSMMNIYFAFIK